MTGYDHWKQTAPPDEGLDGPRPCAVCGTLGVVVVGWTDDGIPVDDTCPACGGAGETDE